MSRRTKYTAPVVAKIAEGLEKGMPRRYAAANAGVAERTFFEWLSKPDFRLRVEQAEARFIEDALDHMQKTGKRQWVKSAWLLERRVAESFGKAERLQIDSNVNVNVVERRQLILQKIVGELPASGVDRVVEAMKPEEEPIALPPGEDDLERHN